MAFSGTAPLQEVHIEIQALVDLLSYARPDASLKEQIKNAVAKHPVVCFSKSWCPYCQEALQTFNSLNVRSVCFQLDQLPNGSQVHANLKTLYSHSTVPYIFLSGEFVGGCDDMKALQRTGELDRRLLAGGVAPQPATRLPFSAAPTHAKADTAKEPDPKLHSSASPPAAAGEAKLNLASALAVPQPTPAPNPFFFPATLDCNVVRVMAACIVAIAVLCIVFRVRSAVHYTVLGLCIDFALRLCWGAGPSPLAQLARVILARTPPRLGAGFPKQFAALCGTMMSGIAALFMLQNIHDKYALSCVMLGIIAVCAGLEAIFNICVGCHVFDIAVRLKLVSAHVYRVHINSKAELEAAWKEVHSHQHLPPTEHTRTAFPGYGPTQIDLRVKAPKWDEHTRQDFHPVKHSKIGHFNSCLGLVGLALAWQVASSAALPLHVSATVWKVLATAAAVQFAAVGLLYGARVVCYPRKVAKEWMHNVAGNAFAVPLICVVIFAALVNAAPMPHAHPFAKALFWIGAPAQLLLGFIRAGDWIAQRHDLEHLNPAWLIAPVGAFVAAVVGPTIDADYREAMYLWFSFALLTWGVLFTLTFYKGLVGANVDERTRPLMWIWVAAPAVAVPAYLALEGPPLASGASAFDFFAKLFYFFALSLACVLAWGCLRGFFGRTRPFDMSADWVYAFALDALAIAAMLYSGAVRGGFTQGMAYTALGVASWVNTLLVLHSLAAILGGGVYVADNKWGPASFMKLIHEALREFMPRLSAAVAAMSPDPAAAASVAPAIALTRQLALVHEEHSRHEDAVLFPACAAFFPGAPTPAGQQHASHEQVLEQELAQCNDLETCSDPARRAELVTALQAALPAFLEDLAEHLRWEEAHVTPIARKHLPLALHKRLVADVWDTTAPGRWALLLPWAVTWLPRHEQRLTLLRCFIWPMPERAQQIGRMLALGVDAVMWTRLAKRRPEIIPRGAPGHVRYY
ncbi:hypothetical protein WJX72_008899 [[Myrmecia] bisecta]|uniref:Uncharacterized protein n=1 Tax=[Myrmecia] bisecta TaxID=41462 RepID=A0AAW1P6N4_9CHLO